MHFIFFYDFIILFFYLIITVIVFKNILKKKILSPEIKKIFKIGLFVKILGGFFYAIVYQYYYNGGDTMGYFWVGNTFVIALFNDPLLCLQQLFASEQLPGIAPYLKIACQNQFDINMAGGGSLLIAKMMFPLCIIGLCSYLPATLFLSIFSFYCSVKLFKVFNASFPGKPTICAWTTLYWPSIAFWGSSINKDTFCYGFLCLLVYGIYRLLNGGNIFKYLFLIVVSSYVIIVIKVYIFLALMPGLLFWLYFLLKNKIQSKFIKRLFAPILIIIIVFIGSQLISKITEQFKQFAFENVLDNIKQTGDYISLTTRDGSGYTLGDFDPNSPASVVKLIPASINVTLFRPYIFESKKPIILISALESFFLLIVTVFVLFKTGIFTTIKIVAKNPFIIFSLFFSIFFAFVVGLSTLNFGSLVRYKIPCLPFYLITLFAIYQLGRKSKIEN
jgi:hypothetical protein